ncbi:MAG: hypothetical protein P9X24_14955 [Candidatus Hatepunaea meridiana]|nr:hypothetical protein [Candidatus Hatepunaea meridiana]
MARKNRYVKIIEKIFFSHYEEGVENILFSREEIIDAAKKVKVEIVKNLGDLICSFRYRAELPDSIKECAPKGREWIISPAGRSRYRFALREEVRILPNNLMVETKILDATPGIITQYATDDEQGLLAKVRYNRLVDIFTGITCFSLQNHLRTTVPEVGQVETDEIYIGVDRRGAHYVFPIQAKGGSDRLSIVQIEQDLALCLDKFPDLICKSIATQFIESDLIAMFSFEDSKSGAKLLHEKHYRLVAPDELSDDEIKSYMKRTKD